jgi:hypothetical protein
MILKIFLKLIAGIKILFLLAILLLITADYKVLAEEVTTPVIAATSRADRSTLGIPRWKGYMSELNPNNFWISYANAGSTLGNINYTIDGGETWSSDIIQIDVTGWLDFHMSMDGRNEELYFTWPGSSSILFRKFNAPAQSNADSDPIVSFAGTTALHRSNVMVQNGGRIWVFTRYNNDASQNVRYNYSDNGGSTWTSGQAYNINHNNIRIGSMPYIDDNPALVVLNLSSQRGYEYYLWNGSEFERKSDYNIYQGNVGLDRAFTHNVVSDTVMHLIFGLDNDLHHCWKNYNNGIGAWNHQIIESSNYTSGMEWYPTSAVKGDSLYLFYCRKLSTDDATTIVYYRRWSQPDQSWSDPVLVSATGCSGMNSQPNTCPRIPDNADYIPVFWQSRTGDYNIFFSRILLGSSSGK